MGATVTEQGVGMPAGSITYNRSGGSYNEVLTVVRYVDALGRELQVRTSACVNGQAGYTVSGAKVYDAMGRVKAEGKPHFEEGEAYASVTVTAIIN